MKKFWRQWRRQIGKRTILSLAIAIVMVVSAISITCTAPSDFPKGKIISIKENTSVSKTASLLVERGVIRSALIYKILILFMHGNKGVMAGDYLMSSEQSVFKIAYRTAYGVQDLHRIKITVLPGMNVRQIATILGKSIKDFDKQEFERIARDYEGYLYPDTYFFFENVKPDQVLETMTDNFEIKIESIKDKIATFDKSIDDIIIMASIVEREAVRDTDKKMVAGVLWHRLAENYPLQVDPPFFYIMNKDSGALTLDDLATTSPYNLYKNKGLTPTPISNPSIQTILDTVTPTETKYWFYLSDKKGNMHYAATHEGHLANIAKYLKD